MIIITTKTDPMVVDFINIWMERKSFISLELTESEIEDFLIQSPSIESAVEMAADYLLSNSLSEVQY